MSARRTPVAFIVILIASLFFPGAARANAPETLHLNGTYRGTYRVPAGATLQGAKGSKIIGQVILEQGSAIKGVEVTGWTEKVWNYSAGIRVAGDATTIQDCYIHHGSSHGIQVIGGHVGTQIIDNTISQVGAYSSSGSSDYPVANWRGISLEDGSDQTLIYGNTITGAWENGIYERASVGVVIKQNTIKAFNRGLVDRWNDGSGNGIEALSNGTVIEGNTVNGGAPTGGDIWGRAGIVVGGSENVVRGNSVSKARNSGIYVIKGGGGVTIEANTILTTAQNAGDAAGIRILAFNGLPRLGVSIDGNTIRWAKTGVAISSGPDGYSDATTVTRNVLNGLRLSLVGDSNVIWGNT